MIEGKQFDWMLMAVMKVNWKWKESEKSNDGTLQGHWKDFLCKYRSYDEVTDTLLYGIFKKLEIRVQESIN